MNEVGINVVVLAGSIAAEPVEREMPSGDTAVELRLTVPEAGRMLLPLPVVVDGKVWERLDPRPVRGSVVLVHGRLQRRFYRSGAGARSVTEVVASGLKLLDVDS